jgi:hypothetical protein
MGNLQPGPMPACAGPHNPPIYIMESIVMAEQDMGLFEMLFPY